MSVIGNHHRAVDKTTTKELAAGLTKYVERDSMLVNIEEDLTDLIP